MGDHLYILRIILHYKLSDSLKVMGKHGIWRWIHTDVGLGFVLTMEGRWHLSKATTWFLDEVHITKGKPIREKQCGLNEKCPPTAHPFEHLVPSL